MLVNTDFSASE